MFLVKNTKVPTPIVFYKFFCIWSPWGTSSFELYFDFQIIPKNLVLRIWEILLATNRHMGLGYLWLVFGCAGTGRLGGDR